MKFELKFNVKSICLLAAALFGLIAFFMMFAPQLAINLIGKNAIENTTVYFGGDYGKGAFLGFLGYILVFLAFAVAALAALFKIEKLDTKVLTFVAAGLFLLAFIFIMLTKAVYAGANNIDGSGLSMLGGNVCGWLFAMIAFFACDAAIASDFLKLSKK